MAVSSPSPITVANQAGPKPNNRWLWVALFLIVLAGCGLFLVPAFIIRPFRYQSPAALWWGMALRQVAPLGTVIVTFLALALAGTLWRRVSNLGRVLAAIGVLVAAAAATMSRMNYFEWMFHHLSSPGFEAAATSRLASTEMVMAVRFGNDGRAYPIREMAYHHVVNDVVGGVPIAVTY